MAVPGGKEGQLAAVGEEEVHSTLFFAIWTVRRVRDFPVVEQGG